MFSPIAPCSTQWIKRIIRRDQLFVPEAHCRSYVTRISFTVAYSETVMASWSEPMIHNVHVRRALFGNVVARYRHAFVWDALEQYIARIIRNSGINYVLPGIYGPSRVGWKVCHFEIIKRRCNLTRMRSALHCVDQPRIPRGRMESHTRRNCHCP